MPGTFGTTTRNLLRYLKGTSLVSDIDEGFQALAEDVDTKMASYLQDTFAKRPAAGQPNRLFKATDTGALFHDTGTLWEPIYLGSPGATLGVVSWGAISEAGAIDAGSGDFTVSKISTGLYEIKWTKAKASANYAVLATVGGTPAVTYVGYAATVGTRTTTDLKIATVVLSGASFVGANAPFSFVVLAAS